MSIGTIGPEVITNNGPALNSTAVAYVRLAKTRGGIIENPVCTFTLQRDGVTVINAQPMTDGGDDFGPGYFKYVIQAEVMTRGNYLWVVNAADPTSGGSAERRGRFRIL